VFDVGSERVTFFDPRQPKWEQGFQTHRPGVTRRLPNGLQDRKHLRAVGGRTPPALCGRFELGCGTVEFGNGVLSVVATDVTEFLQDLCLHRKTCFAITLIDGSEVFPFGFRPHDPTLL
jgi:hypothetical protein